MDVFLYQSILITISYLELETIDLDTLYINLTLVPGIIVGFYIGLKIVDKIKEHQFRKFILVMTAIGAMAMICR